MPITRRDFLGHSTTLVAGAAMLPRATRAQTRRRPHDEPRRPPSAIESQTMSEHWETFIGMLQQRGFKDDDIARIVGGNFLRVMRAVLPAA